MTDKISSQIDFLQKVAGRSIALHKSCREIDVSSFEDAGNSNRFSSFLEIPDNTIRFGSICRNVQIGVTNGNELKMLEKDNYQICVRNDEFVNATGKIENQIVKALKHLIRKKCNIITMNELGFPSYSGNSDWERQQKRNDFVERLKKICREESVFF